MLRKLLWSVLLAPLLLNGLWVVCDDASFTAAAGTVSQELSEQEANCARICARLLTNGGEICLILPGDSKKSITVVDFGAAIVTPEIQLQPPAGVENFAVALPDFYLTPSLFIHTPPPKA